MSEKTTFEIIAELIVDQLGIEPNYVTPESNLLTDLGADSLDEVELFMAVEEEIDCEIPDADAAAVRTVQDLVDVADKFKHQAQ